MRSPVIAPLALCRQVFHQLSLLVTSRVDAGPRFGALVACRFRAKRTVLTSPSSGAPLCPILADAEWCGPESFPYRPRVHRIIQVNGPRTERAVADWTLFIIVKGLVFGREYRANVLGRAMFFPLWLSPHSGDVDLVDRVPLR